MQIFKEYTCKSCKRRVYEQWCGSEGRCSKCNETEHSYDRSGIVRKGKATKADSR